MIGIIGGTGLTQLNGLQISGTDWPQTPWGDISSAMRFGTFGDREVVFLARHGDPHQIPPHLINYRANIGALKQAGVTRIVAVNAVGGIHAQLGPAEIAVPDQIIDYTYGREHTVYDGATTNLEHVDFTFPYTESLRQELLGAAQSAAVSVLETGVYGATQGPRLESAAEIRKYLADGCDMIGMTGMPEAALAREFGLEYACLALSVNWCAGLSDALITMQEIETALEQGMVKIHQVLKTFLSQR